MKNKNKLDDDMLDKVSGGDGGDVPPQLFNIGDRVTLKVYPQYGIGTVVEARLVSGSWQYTAEFDGGTMTADESEFTPAYMLTKEQ